MPAVTYYVAVPFNREEEGNLIPGQPVEATNGDRARRLAQGMADKNAGAIAFSRTGDPDHGDFEDAQVIAVFGAVDVSVLSG